MEVDFNPRFIPAAPVKPALSGLKWMIASQPRVVLRTNPGLSRNVPSGHGLAGWFLGGHTCVSDSGFLAAQRHDSLPIQIQRSGHRGPPPRHSGAGPFRMVFSVGCTLGYPIQVSWLPKGTMLFRSKSSGADTEVRLPAALVLAPFGWCSWWGTHQGFPIQVFWLPIRTILCRSQPNGADAEVHAPGLMLRGMRVVCGGTRPPLASLSPGRPAPTVRL